MRVTGAHWVGSRTYPFRVQDGRIVNIEAPYNAGVIEDASGIRLADPEAWERGDYWADFTVTIDLWRTPEGRIFCGSVDVAAAPGGPSHTEMHTQQQTLNYLGANVTAELTATIWRQIPIGALIDHTMGMFRDALDKYGPRVPPELADTWRQMADEVPQPKPGPKPGITPEMLAGVVAPAYLAGGRKPVVAVQEALKSAGFSSGLVTIDQARKAVVRARQAGLIPPAAKKGKP